MSKRTLSHGSSSPSSRRHKEEKYSKRTKNEANGEESLLSVAPGANNEPSPVVYVRNLRPNVTEADFHDALAKFGSIAYVLCMRPKGQALVEFETLESARTCVAKARKSNIKIAGQNALFEYSKSEFIRRSGLESQAANNVLVLTIYNIQYPITVEVIHKIASRHGTVMRIAMIKGKDDSEMQALVEFDSVVSAKATKKALNGADIYAGCCTLKVEFSKVDRVSVNRNTADRWDYTGRLEQQVGSLSTTASNSLTPSLNHNQAMRTFCPSSLGMAEQNTQAFLPSALMAYLQQPLNAALQHPPQRQQSQITLSSIEINPAMLHKIYNASFASGYGQLNYGQ